MKRQSKRHLDQHRSTFEKVATTTWGVEGALFVEERRITGFLTKKSLALNCLCGCFQGKSEPLLFSAQVAECASLALILSLKAQVCMASIAIRQAAEAAMKAIYFSTHPVEYEWVVSDDASREFTHQFLTDYLNKLQLTKRVPELKRALDELDSDYSVTSRYVHLQNKKYFSEDSLSKGPNDCRIAIKFIEPLYSRVVTNCLFLMLLHIEKECLDLSPSERRIIVDGLTPAQRAAYKLRLRDQALKHG